MFKINDYIVYGINGVCHIEDIRKDNINVNDETEYYVLQPVHDDKISIMVPVNNAKVAMRSISSRAYVLSLIATMADDEAVWIADDRERNRYYRSALKSALPEEWIKIIKSIYSERKARSEIGKKLPKTDEQIMETVEQKLYEEFAFALGISPAEVVPLIHQQIPAAKVS